MFTLIILHKILFKLVIYFHIRNTRVIIQYLFFFSSIFLFQVASKLKELLSPARTFQKNIFNKIKLQRLQKEVDVRTLNSNSSINTTRTKYNSISESVDLNTDDANHTRTESPSRTHKKSVEFKGNVQQNIWITVIII